MIILKLIFIYIIMSTFIDYIDKAHDLFGKYDMISQQITDNKKLLIKHYLENNSIDNEFVRKTLGTNKDNLYDNLKEYFENLYLTNNKTCENLVFKYDENEFLKIRLNYKFILDNKDLFKQGLPLNFKGVFPRNVLHNACKYKNLEMVKLFLEKGADVNDKDNDGWTPLHYACESGHFEIVKYLISLDVDVNAKDDEGWTPLHWARNIETAKLLIEKGAKVNVKDNDGRSPLHIACEYGYTEIAKLLIEKGANVNVEDDEGCTPLHIAYKEGYIEIAELLIEKGAKR
jgi:ankyrin repeat protein